MIAYKYSIDSQFPISNKNVEGAVAAFQLGGGGSGGGLGNGIGSIASSSSSSSSYHSSSSSILSSLGRGEDGGSFDSSGDVTCWFSCCRYSLVL